MRSQKSSSGVEAVIWSSVEDVISHGGEAMAESIFASLHTAYIAKAHGGVDEFGNEWPPLADATIKEKQRNQLRGRTWDDKAEQWGRRQMMLERHLRASGMSNEQAAQTSAALAWGPILSAEAVPINIDTGRLEESLSPEGSEDQIRETQGDVWKFGTEVEYAQYVQNKRPFIPEDESQLQLWVERGASVLVDDIKREAEKNL